ncbi:MAG TPA: hypothetical protein PKH07_14250, partial [bacterium]|nr:hypothetical protein [bacterium]
MCVSPWRSRTVTGCIAALALHLMLFSLCESATIQGVQSGILEIASNGAFSVPINAIDPTKSFLIFQIRHNSDRPGGSLVGGRISSPTLLEFVRTTEELSPGSIAVQWYVATFSSGVSVQRGELQQSSKTVNTSLTKLISLSQSFVLWSKVSPPKDVFWDDNDPVFGELVSTNNLRFRSNAGGINNVIWWQVVEFTNPADISVQRARYSFGSTQTMYQAPLAEPVNLASTFALLGYRVSGTIPGIGARIFRGYLPNATSLLVDRAQAGERGEDAEVCWQIVHLKDSTRVQSGTVHF